MSLLSRPLSSSGPLALLALALVLPGSALAGKKDKVKKKKKNQTVEAVEATPEPAPQTADAPAAPAIEIPAWVADAPPKGEVMVRLLDAGTGPQAELRLAPEVGRKEAMTMTMDMSMGMTMMGMAMPAMDIPTQIYDFELEVTEVGADGNVASTMVLTDVRLEGPDELGISGQLLPILQSMEGLVGTTVTSSRGFVVSSEFDLPEDLAQDARDQLTGLEQQADSLAVPFPEEAVGTGARWEVLRSRDNQGMTFHERLTVTLAEREGDRIVLETVTDQSLDTSGGVMEGLPPGAEVDFTEFSSGGSGRTVLDLGAISPAEGSAKMALHMAMDISIEGTTQPMAMDMNIDLATTGQERE